MKKSRKQKRNKEGRLKGTKGEVVVEGIGRKLNCFSGFSLYLTFYLFPGAALEDHGSRFLFI